MGKQQYGLGHTRITVPGLPHLKNKTAVIKVGGKNLEEIVGGASSKMIGVEDFDSTKNYKAGDMVMYDGLLYKFTEDHTAGEWDASQVEESSIAAGTWPDMTTGDILPKNDELVVYANKYAIQTSGGDADLKNGDAKLYSIKGNLSESLAPFNAATFVSTSMNLVNPNQYRDAPPALVIEGDGIYSSRIYYFPVAKGVWGEYGTTQDNNGYVVLENGTNSITVLFTETKQQMLELGAADFYQHTCPYQEYDGRRYYLPPSKGWLGLYISPQAVQKNKVPSCHIAWSNYLDDETGAFNNYTKNISSIVSSIHSWGMAGIIGSNTSVFDEINFEEGYVYQRVNRVLLSSLTWTMTTETSEDETTTYVFTATVDNFGGNYLCKHLVDGLTNEGNTMVYRSTEITSVESLVAMLEGEYLYYEQAVEMTNPISITGDITVDDFGLTYFLDSNGELVATEAYVTEGFYQSGRDQLFNAVTYQKILAEVVATCLCELDARLDALEGKRETVECTNLIVSRSANIANGMTAVPTPASATSKGKMGDFSITTDYLYVCVADNTWKRVALTTF